MTKMDEWIFMKQQSFQFLFQVDPTFRRFYQVCDLGEAKEEQKVRMYGNTD